MDCDKRKNLKKYKIILSPLEPYTNLLILLFNGDNLESPKGQKLVFLIGFGRVTTSSQIKVNNLMFQLPSEKCLNKTSPILELKSYKNAVEAEGMRRAHVKDSVALCKVMMDIVNDVSTIK